MTSCVEPTLANFRIEIPKMSSVSDDVVNYHLNKAICNMSEDPCYGEAIIYRAAHEIKLSHGDNDGPADDNNGVGALTSASADGLSVGFGGGDFSNTAEGSYWSKTFYGQEYLQLIYECSGGSRVVGGCKC